MRRGTNFHRLLLRDHTFFVPDTLVSILFSIRWTADGQKNYRYLFAHQHQGEGLFADEVTFLNTSNSATDLKNKILDIFLVLIQLIFCKRNHDFYKIYLYLFIVIPR